jgi:hypothetical protein
VNANTCSFSPNDSKKTGNNSEFLHERITTSN